MHARFDPCAMYGIAKCERGVVWDFMLKERACMNVVADDTGLNRIVSRGFDLSFIKCAYVVCGEV